jgi:membrane protease YdiL (CAAX protease family)
MDLMTSAPALDASAPGKTTRLRWGFWGTLGWSVPILAAMIVSQTLGAFAFLRLWRALHPGAPISLADAGSNGAVLAFSLAVSAPIVLAIMAVVIRLSGVALRDYLALKWPSWRELGVGVGVLAFTLFCSGVAAELTGQKTPAFIADTFNSARAAGLLPLLVVSFVFLAPLQEEVLFRGFLYRGFAPALGTWPAIIVVSALWAVTHLQYQLFFVAEIFVLGLAFGWLRAKSSSLMLTFILHATVNAMAILEAFLVTS